MLKDTGNVKTPIRYLSVCSGIEAATVAWEPLGWKPVAFAEIEKFPAAVLAYHHPDVPNLGDMTKINGADFRGKIDVLVGGTPCQSFSVAGLRGGLEDERGNLSLEFVRIADESDPAFVVWENVPGVFSDRGNAFGCFLAALAGEDAPLLPPGGKWTNVGYVLGPRRTIAWRVLDAQYFGLAQRRKRVFLVGCPRNGADPRKILFEFGGRRRDTPPRRKTGTDVAGTLESGLGRSRRAGTPPGAIVNALTGSFGQGGADDNRAQGGLYVPEIVPQAMSCKWSKGTSGPAGDEHHNLIVHPLPGYADDVALPLRAEVFDASEDGTGRQNLVAAFHGSQDSDVSGEITHPLGTNHGRECCVAFAQNQLGEVRTSPVAGTLNQNSNPTGRNAPLVHQATAVRRLMPTECERLQGFPRNYTLIPYKRPFADLPRQILLRSYNRYLARMTRQGKTPLPLDNLIKCADGPRYKALGNSMAVPVMRWLGRRIQAAHEQHMRELREVV